LSGYQPTTTEAEVARHLARNAKRSNKPNPREDRNVSEFRSHRHRDNVVDFDEAASHSPRRKRVELVPRSVAQEDYIDALHDKSKPIVFAMGPAGCGKTLLATQYAVKALQEGWVEKIVITRPAVSAEEEHGFLPGDLVQKMTPWMLPILDVFKEHYTPQQVLKMIEQEVIEIAPLAYMRGRTFKNAIILADEMQNSTVNQMLMVLTRIGENSRMIVTGDLKQHDRGYENNGLKDFVARINRGQGSRSIAVCTFSAHDVERHPVIEEILRIYEDQ
jgi:phosphate starvation-inducible PhoH-like protein